MVLAHQMALASEMVEADAVEALEFQDLAEKYFVSGVPQTTINDGAGTVIGAAPETTVIEEIKRVIKEAANPGNGKAQAVPGTKTT